MSTIQLTNVTKEFGTMKALDNVSITFEENKIYGLLGRNGAGKSTLLNIISNRLFVTAGEVTIDGVKTEENDMALSKIFCMSDKNLYPDSMKIKDIFKLTSTYYPNFDFNYAEKLAGLYTLNTNKKIKNLSTGYTSIYKIIIALSCNAPIVFFDEPVLGLDANHRDIFYKQLIDKYSESPSTYIISTHLIEEAADIIEKVVILKEGKLIMNEDTETVLAMGYSISGSTSAVNEYCADKDVLGEDVLGGLKTAYIKGKCNAAEVPSHLEVAKLDLQKLFIQLTNA
mgnify:FL=1